VQLRPIKKNRAYEDVIEQIIESVEIGDIAPGEKLPSERNLSEQLSISRSVIREALSILQTGNIIEVKPGIGAFLKQDDKETLLKNMKTVFTRNEIDIIQLLEVRQSLEAQAAYLAAKRATKSDLEDIHSALVWLEQAVENKNIGADEDLSFHLAIGRASHNAMIVDLLNLISDRFLEALKETRTELMKRNKVNIYMKEHRNIYNVIVEGDAEKASELMKLHMDNMIEFHQ